MKIDIHAIGVMMYECLRGERPYHREQGAHLVASLMQSNSTAWTYQPECPSALIKLIQRMTASSNPLRSLREVSSELHALKVNTSLMTDPDSAKIALRAPTDLRLSKDQIKRQPFRIYQVVLGMLILKYLTPVDALQFRPISESSTMNAAFSALKHYDRPGSLNLAERNFQLVLQHHPNHAAAVAGLAIVYMHRHLDEFRDPVWQEKGRIAAQRAVTLNPSLAIARTAEGMSYRIQGDIEGALNAYEIALSLDGTELFAHRGKILTHLHAAQWKLAESEIQRGLKKFPQESSFYDLLGLYHGVRKEFKASIQAYQKSISIQPDAVDTYANLAFSHLALNELENAFEIVQTGLKIRPSASLFSKLGILLVQRKDFIAASQAFEKTLSAEYGNPGNYSNWANYGEALIWIPGQEKKAEEAFHRALTLLKPILEKHPNDIHVLSNAAVIFARTKNKAQSVELARQLFTHPKQDETSLFAAGLVFELNGLREDAINAIVAALQLGYPIHYLTVEADLVALRKDQRFIEKINKLRL